MEVLYQNVAYVQPTGQNKKYPITEQYIQNIWQLDIPSKLLWKTITSYLNVHHQITFVDKTTDYDTLNLSEEIKDPEFTIDWAYTNLVLIAFCGWNAYAEYVKSNDKSYVKNGFDRLELISSFICWIDE